MRKLGHFLVFTVTIVLSACSSFHYMDKNEYILYRQEFKGNKRFSKDDLSDYTRPQPNTKILGRLPYMYIYVWGRNFYDTTKVRKHADKKLKKFDKEIEELKADTLSGKVSRAKRKREKRTRKAERKYAGDSATLVFEKAFIEYRYRQKYHNVYTAPLQQLLTKKDKRTEKYELTIKEGNSFMRTFGEKPVLFDTASASYSADQLSIFLFNKGAFNNKVTWKADTTHRKVTVHYTITEGEEYKIRKIWFDEKDVVDPEIRKLLLSNTRGSKLYAGDAYDADKIAEERERIFNLLRQNGYFDVTRQYIRFDVDTSISRGNKELDLYTVVDNPKNGRHIQYKIRKIVFLIQPPDGIPDENKYDTLMVDSIKYITHRSTHYSTFILSNKIRFRPGQLYDYDKIHQSQYRLWGLDMFKFVNINLQKTDTPKDSTYKDLTAYFYAHPNPKYTITQEYGLNVGAGYVPGPAINVNLRNRNLFRGCEIFDISARFAIDGVVAFLDNTQYYRNRELSLNSSFTFPQMLIIPKISRKMETYNPKTRLLTSLASVRRPEYNRDFITTTLNYTFQRKANRMFSISPIDINLINTPRKSPEFVAFLDTLKQNGSNLYVSFRSAIVADINMSYIYNDYEFGKIKKSKYYRPVLELGGNLINLINTNVLKNPKGDFFGLQTYQYVRLSLDYRKYTPLNKRSTLVFRTNVGLARPYGVSVNDTLFILPYEKYFFAGGSNSNRGWLPRRLGPGSYKDFTNSYKYEQPAEILIEFNVEYRIKAAKYLEPAIFCDIGNVWTWRKEPNRPGSEFKGFKSITELGVSGGIGARLNFTFLILRFDFAVPIWDPGETGPARFALPDRWKHPLLNIGIGYPF